MSAYKLPSKRDDVIGIFCRTYTCGAAIEKYLSNLFAFDKNTGLYMSLYNDEDSLNVDNEQQIVWQLNRNTPYNAFDLVRTFKFGELDLDAKQGTPAQRLPSYKAMMKLCKEDVAIKLTLIREKRRPASSESAEWKASLTLNDKNEIERTAVTLNSYCSTIHFSSKCVSTALPSRT